MRIEELVLEGFKSYPVRTQISGWDPSFNAITGLNGSGKSNILDAICFVLGITNMSQMRAQNQQDLIYKRGQAGITKASVTIVFDNSDREKSPVGLESYKQITVTRQIALPNISKYLLNGHKAQQTQIQTLFQGVQLNINNPNFLIMQGRITKVLNMRPQEILGMVEEAAGTRMFEDRKDKAKKTMGKKEKRVQEITSLLAEEITPKLEKLRHEKRSFIQYQKTCSELEHIARTLRAYEWKDAHERIEQKQEEIEEKGRATEEAEAQKIQWLNECEAAEEDALSVTAKRDEEMKKGGKLKKLEERVTELDKEVVKVKTQIDLAKATIKDEEGRVKELQSESQQLEASLAAKQEQTSALRTSHDAVKDEHTAKQEKLTANEGLLQSLLTGLSSGSSGAAAGGGGYMGQLADAKSRVAQASADEEQCRLKLAMNEKELKTAEAQWKSVQREVGDGQKKLNAKKAEVDSLKARVEATGWNAEKEAACETALRNVRAELRELMERRDHVKQRCSQLNFDYAAPYPNFDRSKVKGVVASLISLNREDYNKATALEIAAGGKLFNVIVQDEKVGKDILERGQLKKRVTMIPLTKIQGFKLAAHKLQAAERLAPGKVYEALSLVGYPQDVANAMSYVFADALICEDSESAKKVTFNPQVRVRSVTLQGDVYDPSGTLTGGSAPHSNDVILKAQELIELQAKVDDANRRLQQLERDNAQGQVREQWKKVAQDLAIKEHEMALLVEMVEGSNATRVGAQVEHLKQTIDGLKRELQAAKDKQKEATDECKKLERDMAEFKNNKDGKIDELKAEILKQKAAVQKHAVTLKTKQKDMQTATLELEQLQSDIETAKKSVQEAEAGVQKAQRDIAKLQEQLTSVEASYLKAEKTLKEEQATLSRFDDELKALDRVIKEKKKAVSDIEVRLTKLEHEIQGLHKEKTAFTNAVSQLEKQYSWIEEDRHLFGKSGTRYDFKSLDIDHLRAKAIELEGAQKGMKKKVNEKVMNMIDSVEKRESDLKKMLARVMKDREKIEETIEELDRYKRDALEKTWEKVNGDFGGIFAELLPGNFAKLQPPEGQDLTQGLEVKVQLGSVWKQSLTELSGGQRSLIALSLIMALLQFKPAPMYILDEIDAALDLSHTQHIGQLFRTRFKGSQFIVVSLKEGLFTNANVLFKARFRDGTSLVERTAQRSTSALYASASAEQDDDEPRGGPRRARRTVAS
ncbi:hypothetical protein HGRIS_010677 [Hohenbuehelia grisea]|uniref:Structural maintenance of chromosomes protein n=1 Tax=Hohenbuehelia grisea TaxID=104357 RepID=A0ABR3IXT5_9AGAR